MPEFWLDPDQIHDLLSHDLDAMACRCRAPRQFFQQPRSERVEFVQSIHVELDGFRPIDFSRYALGEGLQAVDIDGGPGPTRTQLQRIADRRGG